MGFILAEKHTSTKLAQFPSSSIPRVLKRVPARFQPRREIRHIVAMIGIPFVGGAGRGTVNIPTYPCMARTYTNKIRSYRKYILAYDELTLVKFSPFSGIEIVSKIKQTADNIFIPNKSFIVGNGIHAELFSSRYSTYKA